MTFTEATDALMERGITLPEVASVLGVAHATVRAYRLDPHSPNRRTPAPGWEARLADMAEARGKALHEVAKWIRGTPSLGGQQG